MSITLTGVGTTSGSIAINETNVITIDNTDHYSINSTTALTIPVGTTAQRPSGAAGKVRYNTTNSAVELHTGSSWSTIGALNGSSSAFAAPSAVYLRDVAGIQTNGTYWITVNGTPTQIYCNFTTAGGGWMSFASAPGSGNWAGVETGLQTAWLNLSYSFGTYSAAGSIGSYWRNYSSQSPTEILFLTGNGTYWIKFPLSYIVGGANAYTVNVQTSGNFPNNTLSANTSVFVLHRSPNVGEDPWINAGNQHSEAEAVTDYMFWGENGNNSGTSHVNFKNANGGIIAFIR